MKLSKVPHKDTWCILAWLPSKPEQPWPAPIKPICNCFGCLHYLSLANKWSVWLPGLLCIQSPLLGAGNFAPFDTLSQIGGGHLAGGGGGHADGNEVASAAE